MCRPDVMDERYSVDRGGTKGTHVLQRRRSRAEPYGRRVHRRRVHSQNNTSEGTGVHLIIDDEVVKDT